MKKILLSAVLLLAFIHQSLAQANNPGPAELKMADSLCSSVARLDLSKIHTKQEATTAYTECVGEHVDILQDLATEKHLDISNNKDMENVGVDLVKDLMKMKCPSFIKLAGIMAKNEAENMPETKTTNGTFKRIDNKGFNYIIITGDDRTEKSFLWLRQFPGSENFMAGTTKYIGKKLKISWQEIEVYLPQAKGYYNLKEITGIDVL